MARHTFKKVVGCALIKFFIWVFENSEYDGLRTGKDNGQKPSKYYKHPKKQGVNNS